MDPRAGTTGTTEHSTSVSPGTTVSLGLQWKKALQLAVISGKTREPISVEGTSVFLPPTDLRTLLLGLLY